MLGKKKIAIFTLTFPALWETPVLRGTECAELLRTEDAQYITFGPSSLLLWGKFSVGVNGCNFILFK